MECTNLTTSFLAILLSTTTASPVTTYVEQNNDIVLPTSVSFLSAASPLPTVPGPMISPQSMPPVSSLATRVRRTEAIVLPSSATNPVRGGLQGDVFGVLGRVGAVFDPVGQSMREFLGRIVAAETDEGAAKMIVEEVRTKHGDKDAEWLELASGRKNGDGDDLVRVHESRKKRAKVYGR